MKPDYSDYYKFIVSVGAVLFSLAVLLPWLLLREPFDTTLKASEITELTSEAQSIIAVRQTTAKWFLNNVTYFSVALAIGGAGFLSYGLYQWNKRQKVRDTKEDIETEKAQRDLDAMQPEQIAQKAMVDVAEQEEAEQTPSEKEQPKSTDVLIPASSAVKQYFRIEKMVRDKLRACFGNDGEVLTNRRIKAAEYDAILQSKNEQRPDVIFEIKYAVQGFKINWVRESVRRLDLATEIYTNTIKRRAISVIFYISPRATLNRISTDSFKHRVLEEEGKIGVTPRIYFIAEEDWEPLECTQLHAMVFSE